MLRWAVRFHDAISMPMSFMVASGRSRSDGTMAVIPARGASVALAMPDLSTASATRVKALFGTPLSPPAGLLRAVGTRRSLPWRRAPHTAGKFR